MWTQSILFLPKFQDLVGLAALNRMISNAAKPTERKKRGAIDKSKFVMGVEVLQEECVLS